MGVSWPSWATEKHRQALRSSPYGIKKTDTVWLVDDGESAGAETNPSIALDRVIAKQAASGSSLRFLVCSADDLREAVKPRQEKLFKGPA